MTPTLGSARAPRRSWRSAALVLCTISAAVASGSASARPDQLPNLVALRPYHVVVAEPDDGARTALRFSFAVANRGEWPLDLASRPAEADTSRTEAWQCTSWITTRLCTSRVWTGTLQWHEDHGHFHFLDFARYELRKLVDGRVDWSREGVIATERKISYCLANGPPDRGSDQDPLGPNPAYLCDLWVGFQGLSPGYVDIYDWKLPGQSLPISDVPNGRYALVVTVNPWGVLLETSARDNVGLTGVRLSGAAHERVARVFRLTSDG